jgi:tetratricopeptide (TPR) repeat protein
MKQSKMKYYFLLLSIFMWSFANANENELWDLANEAYANQDFPQAIELYQTLEDSGFVSANLYYNLGNAYFKTSNIGKSILYYERALKISPSNEDILHNLEFAKLQTIDNVEAVPALFFVEWGKNATALFNSNTWGKISLVFWWVGFLLLAIYFFFFRKKWMDLPAYTFIFLGIISFVFSNSRYQKEYSENFAIMVKSSAQIKNAPDKGSSNQFVIHEGIKVEITDAVNEWAKIKLEDGKVGWIEKKKLEVI